MLQVNKKFFDRASGKTYFPGDVTSDFKAEREDELVKAGVATKSAKKAKKVSVAEGEATEKTRMDAERKAKKQKAATSKSTRVTAGKGKK